MHTLQQTFPDWPVWQQQVRKRLAVSMGIAVLLIAALLLLVKFSPLPVLQLKKIELRLVVDTAPPAAEPAAPEDLVEPEAIVEPVAPTEVIAPAELAEVVESSESQGKDWYADAESAVQDTVTTANHIDSMHAAFDEKRRLAAINFRPSEAVIKKPIWENVETDNIGRKILVSGDCYRVLEDPRATYYEIQRQLGQYITYCNANSQKPMNVAWVADIRERYAYLKYPDGEIPQDILSVLTRQYQSNSQE
jgi:hypothetical protein